MAGDPPRPRVRRRTSGARQPRNRHRIAAGAANIRLYRSMIEWQRCAGRKRRKYASYDLCVIHNGRTEHRRNDGCFGGSCGWPGIVKHGRAFGLGNPRQWRLWTASASRSARTLPPGLTLCCKSREFLPAAGKTSAAGLILESTQNPLREIR